MLPIRTPLGGRDSNRLPNFLLSAFERGNIMGTYILGVSPAAVAFGLGHRPSSIWSTITRDELRCGGETRGRSGRTLEYTERDERMLLRHVLLFPKHHILVFGRSWTMNSDLYDEKDFEEVRYHQLES